MYLLIETVRLENNQLKNVEFHNERMNRSRFELFGTKEKIDIGQILFIKHKYQEIQRVRITYNEKIQNIEIIPYKRRYIKSFKIVVDDTINYNYKYADRSVFAKYLTEIDVEIIIIKNGFVTDTSFSNLVFHDKQQWITPALPLLKGTMREFLIKNGLIIERDITFNEIRNFDKFRLINAFNGFENPFEFDISAIEI
jgi:4-amino-4-deoxychorismate lyase